MLRTRRSLLLAAALAACPGLARSQEALLRSELEVTYGRWRGAFRQQNLEEWLKHMSKWQQLSARNEVVSAGRQWPRAVFELPIAPPDITPLKNLQVKTLGDQARLAYFGQADFGIAEAAAPENLLLVWFLKESGQWKVHKAQYLQTDPQTRAQLQKGDLSALADPQFAMTGVYPPLPKPCPQPYFPARLSVATLGYRAEVTVNDYLGEPIVDTVGGRVVIGGLQRGLNKVRIVASLLPNLKPGAEKKLEVSIATMTAPSREVYKWTPPPDWDGKAVEASFFSPSKL